MEKNWKDILFNEVTFLISVCGLVVGICLYINGKDAAMDKDLAVMKANVNSIMTNHIPHLEAAVKEQSEEIKRMDKNQAVILELIKKLQ